MIDFFRLLENSRMESYYTTYFIDGIYDLTIISSLRNYIHQLNRRYTKQTQNTNLHWRKSYIWNLFRDNSKQLVDNSYGRQYLYTGLYNNRQSEGNEVESLN